MAMYKRGNLKKKRSRSSEALSGVASKTSTISVPVNRFSVKYYGSVKKVEMERRRQRRAGRFVIHPHSSFRFFWDVISLFLLIISILIIPIAITFFSDVMMKDPGWLAFNFFMDSWFMLDIILNFFTGYIKDSGEGDIILDPKVIRRNYLKSWFIIDLISAIPFDYVLQPLSTDTSSVAASRAMKLFRFTKVASLLRLLRISRLIRYVHQWEQVAGLQYDLAVAAVRVFNLVCFIILIGHWNGCLQFLVPMLNNFPNDSWIVVDELMNKSWVEQYSWCLFKAMSHMVCIGYGQQPPKNMTDLWMTMLSMMSGAVCFAMFIGHITALIQSMDSSKRQYKEKYTQVKEYMRYRRLPETLREKVFKYYEHRFQGKMFDEQGILNELSSPLREAIINFNCRHLVSAVPFFKGAESDFVTEVVQKLNFEVFQPKDVIVKEGAVGRTMYFIQQGLVEVRKSDSEVPIKQLADGSFFGVNGRRVASVVAVNYCHTYSLHADDLSIILSNHPLMKKTLEQVAADRLKHIGHKNESLDERLKETDEFFSKATSLAAEIAKHDQTTSQAMTKRNNDYFQPLKYQGNQLKWEPTSSATFENAENSNFDMSWSSDKFRPKTLNKSFSTLSQPLSKFSDDGGYHRSLYDSKNGGSCSRLWSSWNKLQHRDRSMSLKILRMPKFRGARYTGCRKNCAAAAAVDSSLHPDGSSQIELRNGPVLYRKHNVSSGSCSRSAALCKESNGQECASPYADFTGYAKSFALQLNSVLSLNPDDDASCDRQKDIADSSDSSDFSEELIHEKSTSSLLAKAKLRQKINEELEN